MKNKNEVEHEEIFSKALRAGMRTYFFDVRETKAGDYYLTITESKKFTNDDGSFHYKKHKIYLYKEDFDGFRENLEDMTDYIVREKGEEVISERHQSDFKKDYEEDTEVVETTSNSESTVKNFTDVSFDDIA